MEAANRQGQHDPAEYPQGGDFGPEFPDTRPPQQDAANQADEVGQWQQFGNPPGRLRHAVKREHEAGQQY